MNDELELAKDQQIDLTNKLEAKDKKILSQKKLIDQLRKDKQNFENQIQD